MPDISSIADDLGQPQRPPISEGWHSRQPKLFLIYVLGALAAIFALPYFVPLTPTASTSYLFGYNNKAAVALLLVLVAIGAIWTRGLNLKFLGPADSPEVSRKVLAFSLLAVLLGCGLMYLIAGKLGGYGESSYEIDRIWLTSIGKQPYVDFEWPFGAILIYVPLLLHKAFPVTLPQAYYLFWAFNCLLGVWLLYAVVNAVNYPTERKTSIYLLLFIAWLPTIMNMGTHYSLTRYLLPLYCLLLADRRIKRGDLLSYLLADLGILISITILLLYSPETAIAFALSALGIFLISVQKRDVQFFAAYGALIPSAAILFWIASKFHILDTVKASGGGADSFPIIPALHILFLFAALFIAACFVYQQFAVRRFTANSLGLIAFSIPMLTAGLGRCDPGHVLLNCFGIFLFVLLYVSNSQLAWKIAKSAFILIFLVVSQAAGLWQYMPLLAKCGIRSLGAGGENSFFGRSLSNGGRFYISHFAPPHLKQRWQERLDSLLQGNDPQNADLSAIYPGWRGGYLAPFGYRPNGFGTDLTTRVDYGRYEDVENANTPAAVETKLSEIRNNPARALLLPAQYPSYCEFDIAAERQKIEFLFAFPYLKSPANTENVRQPICAYIRQHYSMAVGPSLETFQYGLWIRKGFAGDSSGTSQR